MFASGVVMGNGKILHLTYMYNHRKILSFWGGGVAGDGEMDCILILVLLILWLIL